MTPESPNHTFDDTEIAFASKSNKQLTRSYWLFRMINNNTLVSIGTAATKTALKLRLPVNGLIKATVFRQFCGGETLEETADDIENLAKENVYSVLDYGVEAESEQSSLDHTADMLIKTIDFVKNNPNVQTISSKFTGLARIELLEKINANNQLTEEEKQEYERIVARVDRVCKHAAENSVSLYIDAEETWIQQPIDDLAHMMMAKYNTAKPIVFNTFQMYRTDRLERLMQWHKEARGKYIYGAKLVRGAYMEKERERAQKMGYPSPIHETKNDVDRDYNKALGYCVEHIGELALCSATHNEESSKLLMDLIRNNGLDKKHPLIMSCQLYGMGDHITFNLASLGYNVSKYIPFGPVRDVMPYLIRRAEENTSVGGQMSRELALIKKELRRRKEYS